MKVRDWECGCGHAWTAPVVLAEHTPNLSGEATQWCPRCGQRPVMGSPVREVQPTKEKANERPV